MSSFLAFLVAVTMLAMVPGPATALVIRRSAVHGRRAAVPLIAGIEVGIYAWAMAAALGIATLVAASTAAFIVLKAVGAAVLVALGLRVVQVAVDASWYLVLAAAVGKARGFFGRRRVRQRLERTTGVALVALGARLALEDP